MSNRIIWIDWVKALGIMIVVFCHTPQDGSFIASFLCSFQMPLFFLLAGYLHKNSQQPIWENMKKYWKSLIIPYILLQFINYPYFLIQQNVQEGVALNDFTKFVIMPFAQCLWGVPIAGPTWFVFSLLITKLIADIVFKSRFSIYIIALLCLFSIVGAYIIWQDNVLNFTFAIDSLFNFFPFFFVGYYLKAYNIIKGEERYKNLLIAVVFFVISALFISANNNNDSYLFHRFSFYILGLSGSLFSIYVCKTFTYCPDFIQTISIGNIVILGLHWMFIGTTNFILENIFSIEGGIRYTVIEVTILVILITMANYIIIKFCQKHFKALIGYRQL